MERTFKDSLGEEFKTSKAREINFIEAMEEAGIPWYVYSGRGMFGRRCPSANTSSRGSGIYEDDIIIAAGNRGVKRLAKDNMGLDMVLYTG